MHRLSKLILAVFVLVQTIAVGPGAAECPSVSIGTFGRNDPAWNRRAGLSAITFGCTLEPEECIDQGRRVAAEQEVPEICLAVRLDNATDTLVKRYVALSDKLPQLKEIRLSDTIAHYLRLERSSRGAGKFALARSIAAAARGQRIRIGLTIYEDELDLTPLRFGDLPGGLRSQVGSVYFYLHYRGGAEDYQSKAMRVRKLFPNARLILGSYAYDRISYISCYEGSSLPCTTEQEVSLFRFSLERQLALLKSGIAQGLEFYPAYFQRERFWPHWADPKTCAPERRAQCIANTVIMRQAVESALKTLKSLNGN